MKQLGLGVKLSTKKTRKREFMDEMKRVVPWAMPVQIVEPRYPKAKTGQPPFGAQTVPRIHCLQQWFGLSDPAMEEALHSMPLYHEFAGLNCAVAWLPDLTTILRFRRLLEKHDPAKHDPATDMVRVVNHPRLLPLAAGPDDRLAAPTGDGGDPALRAGLPRVSVEKKGGQFSYARGTSCALACLPKSHSTNSLREAQPLIHGLGSRTLA